MRALTVDEAAVELRSLLLHETPPSRIYAPSPQARVPDEIVIARSELDLVRRVLDESLHTIQAVRHAVPAGRAITTEPRYSEQAQSAAHLLQVLLYRASHDASSSQIACQTKTKGSEVPK